MYVKVFWENLLNEAYEKYWSGNNSCIKYKQTYQ